MAIYQLLFWTVLFLTYATQRSVNCIKLPTNCGTLEKIPGDIRTYAPWTAVIFIRQPDSTPMYLTTGTIIGPNSVLATARGPFGAVLRGTNDDGLLPPRHIFIVAAGLNSTDYYAADAHAQFSEINYLEPSMYHDDENEQYHYIIYHLKTPLNFKTPYVKAICLLEEIKEFKISPFELELSSSGFAVKTLKEPVAELKISLVTSLSKEACSSYFRFHYKRELNENQVFCGAKKGNGTEVTGTSLEFLKNNTRDPDPNLGSEEFCFLHGSVTLFELSEQWFLASVITLIPGRKKGQCNDQNIYMYGRIGAHISWLVSSTTCSPEFACEDAAKTCIPIKTVCNGVVNCPSGKDEQERFCRAQNECNVYTKKPMHSCGITGKCIPRSELCNGKSDCEDGSDEENELCPSSPENTFGLMVRSAGKTCPTLKLPKRVQANCSGTEDNCLEFTAPKSSVTLYCQEFYESSFEYSSVVMTCDGKKGAWEKNLPFSCSPMCGIFPASSKSENFPSITEENLAWNGIVFSKAGLPGRRCSAVFIDSSFALTSARCIENFINTTGNILHVVQPLPNESPNLNSRKVSKIWTRTPQFKEKGTVDLALIRLEPPSAKHLEQTPVCFLTNANNNPMQFLASNSAIVIHMSTQVNSTGGKTQAPQTVRFKLLPREDCKSKFGAPNFPEYVFCAKMAKGSVLRSFDQGTGLYIRQKNPISGDFQFQLQGITVQPQLPLISNDTARYQLFVNTSYFLDWVTEIMEKNY